MRLYYDGDCGFCRTMVRRLVARLPAGAVTVFQAQDDPRVLEEMIRTHSWIVIDHRGRRYFKSQALAAVLRRSRLRPFAWLLERAPVRWLADRIYDWIAGHRPLLGRIIRPPRG